MLSHSLRGRLDLLKSQLVVSGEHSHPRLRSNLCSAHLVLLIVQREGEAGETRKTETTATGLFSHMKERGQVQHTGAGRENPLRGLHTEQSGA